jgi:hypothetical protein
MNADIVDLLHDSEDYRYRITSIMKSGLLRNNHLLALCSWFVLPGTRVFPPPFLLDGTAIKHSALELRSLVDWLWQVSFTVHTSERESKQEKILLTVESCQLHCRVSIGLSGSRGIRLRRAPGP